MFTIDSVSNKTVDSVERKKPPIQTITSDEDSDTEYDSETGIKYWTWSIIPNHVFYSRIFLCVFVHFLG